MALALALLLAFPAAARAGTQTATLGAVSATITWKSGSAGPASDLSVRIVRAGATLVDGPVTVGGNTDDQPIGPALWPDPLAVKVADLDHDGEPEVIVAATTDGAHCCTTTKLWTYTGSGYQASEHAWLDEGYRVRGGVLVGAADFSYAFGSYAESRSPLLVLDGHFQDVTGRHPFLVMRDLRSPRHFYARYRGRYDVRPALGAYVADLYSLGRGAQARHVLTRALRSGWLGRRDRYDFGPFGHAYIRSLNHLLRQYGYV
jgi:hypothetical protein